MQRNVRELNSVRQKPLLGEQKLMFTFLLIAKLPKLGTGGQMIRSATHKWFLMKPQENKELLIAVLAILLYFCTSPISRDIPIH